MVLTGYNSNYEEHGLMTNTDRPYHHGGLRQFLIEAACRHIGQRGIESLSLRALAREAGVSQTAPYRHFKTKNSLIAAIAMECFSQLHACLVQATEKAGDDTLQAILACGPAYMSYALANPERYKLTFDSAQLDFQQYPELKKGGDACFSVLIDLINRGLKEDLLIDKPAHKMAGLLWATLHGVTSLVISQSGVSQAEMAEDRPVVHALRGLVKKPGDSIALVVRSLLRDPSLIQ